MEKIFTRIKNNGVWHSFEKMKPQLCFFFKKPFLVSRNKTLGADHLIPGEGGYGSANNRKYIACSATCGYKSCS